MRRTEPVFDRIKMVSVVKKPGSRLMPARMEPSVTPVAAKDNILRHHLIAAVDPVQIRDPGLGGPAALVIIAEGQTSPHLPAHTFQGGSSQDAFGSAAKSHIHVDAGRI